MQIMNIHRLFIFSFVIVAIEFCTLSTSYAQMVGKLAPTVTKVETIPVVTAYSSVFTKPPMPLPRWQQLDAPLLGNGDMGVAISGDPENQQFWLSKNDLWELRHVWLRSGPRPFGHIDILIPGLKDATYNVEQNLVNATTISLFKKAGNEVSMRSWVSANENLLFVELTNKGRPLEGEARLWIPAVVSPVTRGDHRPQPGLAIQESEVPSSQVFENGTGIFWGTRAFRDDVEIPSEVACAFKLLGGEGQHFKLEKGKPVILIANMRSLRQSSNYVSDARERVASLDRKSLVELYTAHTKWWRNFWDKSSVELGDTELEWRYNVSNYILASCSRDPDYPPGIAGTWVTTDQPMWTGAYTFNYNHEACFYGLYSSNHIEQADPEDAPALAFLERGRYYAKEVLNCRGVLYPVKIGPVGIETTRDDKNPNIVTQPADKPWLRQKGGLFLGQRSNAAYAAVNMAQRWYTTYDLSYARKVYPFIRDVALFWEDYLKFEPTPIELIKTIRNLPDGLRQPADGRYVIYNDGVYEGGQDMNPIQTLGLIRNVLKMALDMSKELGVDNKEQEKWRYILLHMSAFSTQERNGKTVFRLSEQGVDWGGNTLVVQHIYPACAIGLGSDPKLLEVSRNTITESNRWIDTNGSTAFFPAAVRVGYNPEIILSKLHELKFHPNGIVYNEIHMLENSSIVPTTVNEMLLQSYDGTIRFFPVWPKNKDARFHTLRAYGAFLISAAISSNVVKDVLIVSEKGRKCVVQNPWPGQRVKLVCNGQPKQTIEGDLLIFNTVQGDRIELIPTNHLNKR